jgi:uncharacterized protein YceK
MEMQQFAVVSYHRSCLESAVIGKKIVFLIDRDMPFSAISDIMLVPPSMETDGGAIAGRATVMIGIIVEK